MKTVGAMPGMQRAFYVQLQVFGLIFAATIHCLLLSTMPRITRSRALQLILQLCALLMPAIEAKCYILHVAICSHKQLIPLHIHKAIYSCQGGTY